MGRIAFQGVGHHLGGKLLPKRVAFFRVEGNRHHIFPADLDSHHVPDEFARGGKGKIAHIVGVELPGLGLFRKALLSLLDLFLGDDHHRLVVRLFGQLVAPHHFAAEYLLAVQQLAGGVEHVVGRHGDVHIIVPEGQGKLPASPELVVLPPFHVAVNGHARKELGDHIGPVAVLLKIFIS